MPPAIPMLKFAKMSIQAIWCPPDCAVSALTSPLWGGLLSMIRPPPETIWMHAVEFAGLLPA